MDTNLRTAITELDHLRAHRDSLARDKRERKAKIQELEEKLAGLRDQRAEQLGKHSLDGAPLDESLPGQIKALEDQLELDMSGYTGLDARIRAAQAAVSEAEQTVARAMQSVAREETAPQRHDFPGGPLHDRLMSAASEFRTALVDWFRMAAVENIPLEVATELVQGKEVRLRGRFPAGRAERLSGLVHFFNDRHIYFFEDAIDYDAPELMLTPREVLRAAERAPDPEPIPETPESLRQRLADEQREIDEIRAALAAPNPDTEDLDRRLEALRVRQRFTCAALACAALDGDAA